MSPSNLKADVLSEPKQPNVEIKSDYIPESLSKDTVSSLLHNCVDNHVEVFMKNGVLVVKINILELLSPLSSDSEDSQSTIEKRKSSSKAVKH